jgi:cell division protein FtsB
MLTNEVTLNIYLLASIVVIAMLVGFSFRARMIIRSRAKIEELEREILSNYEQILELERETLNMEAQMRDIKSPVIAMKPSATTEELRSTKKTPDISLRKALLSKKNIQQQSASGL